jgi:uncharacterized membrane protein (UPF0136 family)
MILKRAFIVSLLLSAIPTILFAFLNREELYDSYFISVLVFILCSPFYLKGINGERLNAYSILLLILGLIFKSMHWPGASILSILSVIIFGLIYGPVTYLIKQKEAPLWLRVYGMLCLLAISSAWLFKIQHWPGSPILFTIGIPSWFGFLIILFLFGGHRKLRFTRMDIVIHVAFFSLASQALVSRNARIKMEPEFSKLYVEMKRSLQEAEKEVFVLKSVSPLSMEADPFVSHAMDVRNDLKSVRLSYESDLRQRLEYGQDSELDLNAIITTNFLDGTPLNYVNDYILFETLSFDTVNILRKPYDNIREPLISLIEYKSNNELINDYLAGSELLNPFIDVVWDDVGEVRIPWYNSWIETAHGKTSREMLSFFLGLEASILQLVELKILHDNGYRELSERLAEMKERERDYIMTVQRIFLRFEAIHSQFNLILIVLVLLFVLYMGLAPRIKNQRMFQSITFLFFVLLFEYVLFLSMPYWENKYGNNMIILFVANALMAMLLVPVHNYFENMLHRRFNAEIEEKPQDEQL